MKTCTKFNKISHSPEENFSLPSTSHLPTAQYKTTIYEIYKRNIAQIVIKNVRTRMKESKQKKQKQK